MKIILATPIYSPDIGGPAEYVKNLAEGLEKAGCEVAVLSYGEGSKNPSHQPSPTRGEGVIFVRKSRFKHFGYFWKLFRLARKADIIYALDPLSVGLPAFLASKITGAKFFMRLGGDYLWERDVEAGRAWTTLRGYYESELWKKRSLEHRLLKKVFGGVDQFIFTTNFLAEIYKRVFKISGDKIVVIENPFLPFKRPKVISNDIIFAGRFIKLKNLDNLISAFKNIQTASRLVLIGAGPEEKHLKDLIKDSGLEGRVSVSPSLSHEKLAEVIAGAKMCVLPSLSEVSPNFALECLSQGTPILLTRENGLNRKEIPGSWLFDPLDNNDLENKLRDLLIRPNHEFFLTVNRSWKNVVDEHLKILCPSKEE